MTFLNQVQYRSIQSLEQKVNSHFAHYTCISIATFAFTDTNMNTLFQFPKVLLST